MEAWRQVLKKDYSGVLELINYHQSCEEWCVSCSKKGSSRTSVVCCVFSISGCECLCVFTQVNVFGFGADADGNWHHYWEKNMQGGAFRHTGVHDGDYEYNITLLLADKHKITLHTWTHTHQHWFIQTQRYGLFICFTAMLNIIKYHIRSKSRECIYEFIICDVFMFSIQVPRVCSQNSEKSAFRCVLHQRKSFMRVH